MKIKFVDLHRQYMTYKNEIDAAMQEVINSSAFIGNLNNPFVNSFESNFAQYIGIDRCVACGNGTDAIEILLKAMNIGPGDEVIVPAISWIATSEAVSSVGGKPVFVDIEPEYYCINPNLIEEKITSKTKVIIPVHLYGQPADIPSIMKIAKKHNLLVLEDCAQAHGAEVSGRRVGTFGDAASFSFFPGKNLGAFGDAGCMITDDPKIADKARMISQHGQSGEKHAHIIEGRNSRMDGLQAAVLNVKLNYIEDWTESRIAHATEYRELLKGSDVILPMVKQGNRHVYHLFVIRTKKRDAIMKHLKERGIATAIQYPKALPFLKAYENFGHKKEDFPVAAQVQDEIVSLPIFPELHKNEIDYICSSLKSAL